MKKRTKKYTPRQINLNAAGHAMTRAMLLTDSQKRDILSPLHAAFSKLREGKADRDDWNTIASGMNIAEGLCMQSIANDKRDEINCAQDALEDIAMRMLGTGKSTCYAQELDQIATGIEIHAIQIDYCSHHELIKAIQKIQDVERSGGMQIMKKLYEEKIKEKELVECH